MQYSAIPYEAKEGRYWIQGTALPSGRNMNDTGSLARWIALKAILAADYGLVLDETGRGPEVNHDQSES